MSKLSERMLALRKEKGKQKKIAAAEIGISLREYQRYEYGQREPTASSIIALANLYGVSADYLLGMSDNPHPEDQNT